MSFKKISQLTPGETIISFFLIRKVECRNTNSGNKYLDFILSDNSGEIVAKLWDCSPEEESQFAKNMLIKVKGTVVEWQGRKQLKIDKIRLVEAKDEVDIEEFVPVAPYPAREMYAELLAYLEKIGNSKLKETVRLIIDEVEEKLMTWPAALHNHHSLRSGLLYHTLTMLKAGEALLQIYPFLNKDLLLAGIILHDIAKIEEIEADELGQATAYSIVGQLLGHIVQGIKKIDWAARQVGLDEELSLQLQHMILAHHYEPEFGSPKKPMFPEAELLHYLDILDARMFDMQKALDTVEPGEFSDRIWALDNRRLYKSNFSG
ncbi:MAG: HD domain-containing protein [Peptococcaceae bacterium]|nr:HD domain-containing protein [Peptococcaceae bacterium]